MENGRLAIDKLKLRIEDWAYIESLLKRYPSWSQCSSMKKTDFRFIPVIEVPSAADPEKKLIFWSDADAGPTFEFAGWRGHGGDLTSIDEAANFDCFWEILPKLLQGELVVVRTSMRDGFSYSLLEKDHDDCKKGDVFSWV